MGGRYRGYAEYKKSDVDMLSELPADWETKQVRYLLKDGAEGIKIGPFGSALKLEDMVDSGIRVYGQENVIKKDFTLGKRRISQNKFEEMQVYQAYFNDLLITMMGTSGKCELVPENADVGIIDSHLLRLRVNEIKILPRFFRLLIDECYEVENQIKISGKGSIMHGLNSSIVKSLQLPLPSTNEQEHILSFLDHETAKIDTLIEKQQQLIKLLKEKRQAVISHAVTKGLPSTTGAKIPMRDSGVEWLGEVPEHWVTCTLRRYSDFVDGDRGSEYPNEKDFKDDGVVFLSSKNISEEKLDLTEVKFISQEKFNVLSRGKALDGDLIVKVRGSVGRIGELAKFETAEHGYETAFINAQMMIIRTHKGLLTNYLLLVSQSLYWTEQLAVGAYGTAQQQLSNDVFSNLFLVVPPEGEQLKINEKLEQDLLTFNGLIGKAQKAISLMQERRSALISAAVTGKIDVRNWQAPEQSQTNKENVA